jgi:hypothetical protein
MPSLKDKTRSAIWWIGDIQTLLGVPWMWSVLSYGLSIVVIATAPIAWYWRLVLWLVVANLMLGIVFIFYSTIFYGRIARVRAMRKLFKAAADRLVMLSQYPLGEEDFAHALENVHNITKFDVLIFQSLRHPYAVDYDDFNNIAKWRARQKREKLNTTEKKAEYFTELSHRLSFEMIEPTFHIPANLDEFLMIDVVYER